MSYDANRKYYETAGVAEYYGRDTTLWQAEEVIFSSLRDEIRDRPILEVGVGAGRTTPYLRVISKDYIGIDHSATMIDLCRSRNRDATLLVADARCMTMFGNEQFAAVFWCFNGIDEVDPLDRNLILKEVNRTLEKNGSFIFSSHNLDWGRRPLFSSGRCSLLIDPIAFLKELSIRLRVYATDLLTRLLRRVHRNGWAVILEYDRLTGMVLPTYYVSKEAQTQQLLDAGFWGVQAVSIEGRPVDGESRLKDHSLYYVARKR